MDPGRIRELLAGLACPLCGGTRGDTLLIVVDAPVAGTGAVRVQCVRCHLFWSFNVEPGARALGIQAEDDAAEAKPARPPISIDEVIELHCRLRDLDGPLQELFAEAT